MTANKYPDRSLPALIERLPCTPAPMFLTGGTGFLGGHFLLWKLQQAGHVFALVRGDDGARARNRLVEHLTECAGFYKLPLPASLLQERLTVVLGDISLPGCNISPADLQTLREVGIGQVWHCAASLKFEDRHRKEIFHHNVNGTRNVLEFVAWLGTSAAKPAYFHISTAYSAGRQAGAIEEKMHPIDAGYNNAYEESKNLAEHEVANFCGAKHIDYRVLRPSIIMGPLAHYGSGGTRFGVYGFAKEVYRLRETLSKMTHRLELVGQEGAALNLTPVDECVHDMLTLSAGGFGDKRYFHLANPRDLAVGQVISVIDRMVGTEKLRFVSRSRAEPSPLQKLFDRRTKFYEGYYRTHKRFERQLPEQKPVEWSDFELYMAAFLHELRSEDQEGVGFERLQVLAPDGEALWVYRCGSAELPPLVLANAYGMPADFMAPLAQRLSEHFHVVTWEARWVPTLRHRFDKDACDSLVHVHDLLAILDHLQLSRVALAGWSSGAQVTLRALSHAPERFTSAVLMNPGVSLRPSEDMQVSRFESSIRSLFPKIAGNYRMAEKYCELIYGTRNADAQDQRTLTSILTSTDPYLLYMTSQPFRTPESLYRYANMMHAMFSEREDAWARDIKHPVLLYIGQHDVITHPDIGHALQRQLASGVLHLDENGDHFSHYYDQIVADRIRSFVHPEAQTTA